MYSKAERRLARFINSGQVEIFKNRAIGLEKETLRVAPEGGISQLPHPLSLGSALTHPWITTDYSEALLEFITPPLADITQAMQFLDDVQRFVYSRLENDELLWATSMPCVLAGEKAIPIARYGTSHAGMMKHVYRRGLGYRYGRIMQVIAGVHFNFSLSDEFWSVFQQLEEDQQPLRDFVSQSYFGLIRNLQRFGWLIPYLFGASPAVCKSFFAGTPPRLQDFDDHTYYGPFATSLRLSDIGYQNKKEHKAGLFVCYDNLDAYIESLTWAIETPHPAFEEIGVLVDGEHRQLNPNVLQIENEYYSTTRPKQITGRTEKPTRALRERGVRYVELRSLDVSAFDPTGVNADELRFLEAFLVFCLLHESPAISSEEHNANDDNQQAASLNGRDPALFLQRQGRGHRLRDWAGELCDIMEGICDTLDQTEPEQPYTRALNRQKLIVSEPEETPSARMLAEMRTNRESFFEFAMRMSQQHQAHFEAVSLAGDTEARFEQQTRESLEHQRELENSNARSFEEYLRGYFEETL